MLGHFPPSSRKKVSVVVVVWSQNPILVSGQIGQDDRLCARLSPSPAARTRTPAGPTKRHLGDVRAPLQPFRCGFPPAANNVGRILTRGRTLMRILWWTRGHHRSISSCDYAVTAVTAADAAGAGHWNPAVIRAGHQHHVAWHGPRFLRAKRPRRFPDCHARSLLLGWWVRSGRNVRPQLLLELGSGLPQPNLV